MLKRACDNLTKFNRGTQVPFLPNPCKSSRRNPIVIRTLVTPKLLADKIVRRISLLFSLGFWADGFRCKQDLLTRLN